MASQKGKKKEETFDVPSIRSLLGPPFKFLSTEKEKKKERKKKERE